MFKSSLDFFAAQLCSKLELFQERGFRKKGKAIALVKYPIFDQQIFYPNLLKYTLNKSYKRSNHL